MLTCILVVPVVGYMEQQRSLLDKTRTEMLVHT